jgi:hypothetical protein
MLLFVEVALFNLTITQNQRIVGVGFETVTTAGANNLVF